MRVTYNWLKDFVEIKIPARELADKLTMGGLEVTSLEQKAGDFVFEIEVTSNRPDCLSVAGIAREIAAITHKKLKSGSRFSVLGSRKQADTVNQAPKTEYRDFKISVEDKNDCPLYTAKIIRDARVGPSPEWLVKRLELIGCRSVNNIVDVTNYILFNYGQPLHAFDLDKIAGQPGINIRRARKKEEITTIDGIKRILDENVLIIASRSADAPIALAGVMGGKDTEVTAKTQNILLEAAAFDPVIVRKGRLQLGLESESAYRFERRVTLENVAAASWQALQLIRELAGGRFVLALNCGIVRGRKKKIKLSADKVREMLGVKIACSKIKEILESLGFQISSLPKSGFLVGVPTNRLDINLEIDLIEEISRIFGYDRIPVSLPAIRPSITLCQADSLVAKIKNILSGMGLNEVITHSLIDRDALDKIEHNLGSLAPEISNPLSREQEVLRPRLIPSLLKCLAYNLNQKAGHVYIFEIAKSFVLSSLLPKEELALGVLICGERTLFLKDTVAKDSATILHLKGMLEELFARLGISDYIFRVDPQDPRKVNIILVREKIGEIIALSGDVLDKFQIKNKEVFALELSLEKIKGYLRPEKKYIPVAKYPAVIRDISFILKEGLSVAEVLAAIEEKGRPLLRQLKISDYYRGKQIPDGYKGLTISCVYRLDQRTLLEAEVIPTQSLILEMLGERFGAKIR